MTLFYYAFIIALMALLLRAWNLHQDPFHPWIYLIPQFIFLYGVMPLAVIAYNPDRFLSYTGGWSDLLEYQLITSVLTGCMLWGSALGARVVRESRVLWRPLAIQNALQITILAAGLGALGTASWLYAISNVGGFEAAYGRAYGGGWDDSGYVREMPAIGLVGALSVFLLRAGKRMRSVDWALTVFCVLPTLTQGILGARRGPTFMAVIVLLGGYFYFTRKRVSLTVAASGGVLLGMLMLFLVLNRNEIYFGSELSQSFENPFEYLDQWDSNEYLLGSATVRYAQQFGGFYGARELTHILARPIPHDMWPTKYEDIGAFFGADVNLTLNNGVSPSALHSLVGWLPSVGSAVGFVGDLWLEYQYLAPIAAMLVGFAYGRLWRHASVNLYARLTYPLFAALSVYLVMQDEDAWLFRVLLFVGPTLILAYVINSGIRYLRPGVGAANSPKLKMSPRWNSRGIARPGRLGIPVPANSPPEDERSSR
jgi:hypothetical protein